MYHPAAIAEPFIRNDALVAVGLQLAFFTVLAVAGINHTPPRPPLLQVYYVPVVTAPPQSEPPAEQTETAPTETPIQSETADIGLNADTPDSISVTVLASLPTKDDTAREDEKKRKEREKREKAEAEKAKEEEARQEAEAEKERQRQEAIAAAEKFAADQQRAKEAAAQAKRKATLDKRMDRDAKQLAGAIINRINDYLKTPKTVPNSSDVVVVVHVKLNRDGSLIGIPEILEPSGFPEYDDAAVRAILQASPLPMPKERYILQDEDRLRQFLSHNLIITPK